MASSSALSDAQIHDLYDEIDRDNVGFVTLNQLTERLDRLVDELWSNSDRRVRDVEHHSRPGLQDVFHDSFSNPDHISKQEFTTVVQSWNVPAPPPRTAPKPQASLVARLNAQWMVEGPRLVFLSCIVGLQIAFGLWQMIKYLEAAEIRSAFGWGVVLSKTAAGAIYPTMFFLLLTMSRYFATLVRRFRWLPRILNWDRSQSTHVWMAIVGLALSTLHAIGYLAGSFIHGSERAHTAAVQQVFRSRPAPKSYDGFIRLLPGWSGITALGLYWIIALLSLPRLRTWSWSTFQVGHLLMFPFIGLLCAHGTLALLQQPILGYWLAFPVFLMLLERSSRLAHGCRRVPARLEILDERTVSITFDHPRGNWWNYEAGQYVFVQVPCISYFQWHPFTISSCTGKMVQVHIQTEGNWTRRLRSLPTDKEIQIGVDGPFGAPAQRFYEFERVIVLGAGVGVTPFSAILTDLEQKLADGVDPWAQRGHSDSMSTKEGTPDQRVSLPSSITSTEAMHATRRVDFHWVVREREDLLWFSTLLNRAHDLSLTLPRSSLELNIHPYITSRSQDLSSYVFRHILDGYRSASTPYSLLTGLKMRSRLGRPDIDALLSAYHEEMKRLDWARGRVGVFFCGNPHIGRLLADACTRLNSIAQRDGSRIRYVFIMEVFG